MEFLSQIRISELAVETFKRQFLAGQLIVDGSQPSESSFSFNDATSVIMLSLKTRPATMLPQMLDDRTIWEYMFEQTSLTPENSAIPFKIDKKDDNIVVSKLDGEPIFTLVKNSLFDKQEGSLTRYRLKKVNDLLAGFKNGEIVRII